MQTMIRLSLTSYPFSGEGSLPLTGGWSLKLDFCQRNGNGVGSNGKRSQKRDRAGDRACSLRRHRGLLQTTDQRAAPFSTSSIGCWTFGVGRLLEDFSGSSPLTSLCFLTPRRSGTPCCSSKHDSKLFKSTGTRGCAPFGAALRYCTGHAIGCSSSRAARNGQYGSRKNSRAIITASACPVRMMCSA